jgi:hypothetical protein
MSFERFTHIPGQRQDIAAISSRIFRDSVLHMKMVLFAYIKAPEATYINAAKEKKETNMVHQ